MATWASACIAVWALLSGLTADLLAGRLPAFIKAELLRYRLGPATGGCLPYPALADITGDDLPDLLVATGTGDILVYPRRGDGFTAPSCLAASAAETGRIALVRIAIAPWPPQRPTHLLVAAGRLLCCRIAAGRIGAPKCVAVQERVGAKGWRPRSVAAIDGTRIAILDATGALWIGEFDGAAISRLSPALGADGRPLTLPPGTSIAWHPRGILAAWHSTVALFEQRNGRWAESAILASSLRDPFGREVRISGACWSPDGRVVIGSASGPLLWLSPKAIAQTEWLLAEGAPADVEDGYMTAGDWDGNGLPDLIAACGGRILVSLARRDGLAAPAPAAAGQSLLRLHGPAFPALADLDGDGDSDLLAGLQSGAIAVWTNDRGRLREAGNLEVGGHELRLSGMPTLAALDWEGDGATDLLVGRVLSGEGAPIMFLHNDAPAGRRARFNKAVPIDIEWSRRQAPFAYGGQWMAAPFERGLWALLGPSGVYMARVISTPPAYPRLALCWGPPPLVPGGLARCVAAGTGLWVAWEKIGWVSTLPLSELGN